MSNPIQYVLLPDPLSNSFVVEAYLTSHFHDEPFNHCHKALYFPEARRFLERLLSHSLVIISSLDGDPKTFFSFVIYQYKDNDLILHYAYTKSDFRRQHLLVDIVDSLIIAENSRLICSAFPKSQKVWDKLSLRYPHIIYDPFFFHSYRCIP